MIGDAFWRKECAQPAMFDRDPPGMVAALEHGCRLHVFRSGGGLRVARLEKEGVLKGYGEHPYVELALGHAAEDYLAGQRPYKEVYGGLYDHYLTGSADASGDLDRQIVRGRTLDAWREDSIVICEIRGSAETPTPKRLEKAVMRNGKPRRFKHRGFEYEISPFTTPNGSKCVSISVVGGREARNGADPWVFHVVQTGRGDSLAAAIKAALAAKETEANDEGGQD